VKTGIQINRDNTAYVRLPREPGRSCLSVITESGELLKYDEFSLTMGDPFQAADRVLAMHGWQRPGGVTGAPTPWRQAPDGRWAAPIAQVPAGQMPYRQGLG
jgi:hypothetical protein